MALAQDFRKIAFLDKGDTIFDPIFGGKFSNDLAPVLKIIIERMLLDDQPAVFRRMTRKRLHDLIQHLRNMPIGRIRPDLVIALELEREQIVALQLVVEIPLRQIVPLAEHARQPR
ncbi:hypothetical protein D3C80_799750 [compost metagenome]